MNTHHQGRALYLFPWFMIGICWWMILSASAGHAETYIAGQFGFTLAQDTLAAGRTIPRMPVCRQGHRFPMLI